MKVVIKTAGEETKAKMIATGGAPPPVGRGSSKPLAGQPALTH